MKAYRRLLIPLTTIIVIFGFAIVNGRLGVKMISGNDNSIDKITFLLNSTQEKKTKEIIDKKLILEVLEIFQRTYNITTTRYPSHGESMQANSILDIIILYNNGSTEVIHTCEISTRFYRFLETKGSLRDLGYIVGTNDSVWSFVEEHMT
jgi:hypothetical protein